MLDDQTCGQTPAQDQNCFCLHTLQIKDSLNGFACLFILVHLDVTDTRAQVEVSYSVVNLRVFIFQAHCQG